MRPYHRRIAVIIVLQAIVVLIAVVVLTLNLLIDLSYGVLDPRVRYQ